MGFNKICLGEVIQTNTRSYKKGDCWAFVNYLDTGNITENVVCEIQRIDLDKEPLPSRAKRKVQYNSIIYSTVRPNQRHYGIIKNIPQNFLVSTGFTVIDAIPEKIDANYLFYLLTQRDIIESLQAIAEQSVSTYPSISPSDIENLEVWLPELSEQKKIAAILSALDEKIAINRAINENLERQAQALFKSWFVDFDSVSKLGFTESELGDLPYGWRIYTLSEFLPVKTGKKNANVSSDKGAYPFFSCSQDFSWTDEYSFEGHAILVAGNGDFNVKWYNGKFEAYQRTYVLIPYVERYTDWLYYAVKYNLESITSAARGSVIKFITKGNLENFAFAAPENLEKCEIIDTFSSINRMINALTQENYRLAEIRDSLLPKLMAGEIDASAVQL